MAEVMLPYRTDWRAMGTLLDYAKGKGVDRATLEARMGAGSRSARPSTRPSSWGSSRGTRSAMCA